MGKGIIVIKDTDRGMLKNENGKELKYVQSNSDLLGLKENAVVRFDVYHNDATKEKTAYNVELQRTGIIVIKDTDRGMIKDPNFGEIEAVVPFMKERGFEDGATVKYFHLKTDKGVVAVYVELVDPTK
ncbi:MAG: hypothetical protein JNL69_06090 [Bacteroidia bacterium]|nr:hypothetical protein [Bacteroidia bacterium]